MAEDCDWILDTTESSSVSQEMPLDLVRGGWGRVPPAFQLLPDEAELCGSYTPRDEPGFPIALISSTADIATLLSLYTPAADAAGCTVAEGENATSATWTCTGSVASLVGVITYGGYYAITLFL